MKKATVVIAFVIIAVLLILLNQLSQPSGDDPLICHVGGTMTPVLTELAKMYQQKTGQAVEINSAGSGELLAHIDLHKRGDVYVSHDPFLDILMQKFKMGIDGWLLAELTPVIAVSKGNPKNIQGLKDLTRDDVELNTRWSLSVGRDGQIFFGEDEDLGHLWIYFPSVCKKK
ncbi:substrate-binding domain-containing protein [Planctomycetota bacterium]